MQKNEAKPAGQRVADRYLHKGGLTFDFDAGHAPYDYRVSVGSDRNDALGASAARDYLWGLNGHDSIAGGAVNDNLYGDSGNDVITGGAGNDLLLGGKGDDQLFAGDGNDAARGGDGNDWVDEGAGHGDLDGGMGNDTLVGGRGADAFMVMPGMGDDVIKDFTAGPGMFDHLAIMDMQWEDLSFTDTGAGVRISFAGGSVLLEGVYKADLAQDDFMFGDEPELPPGSRAPDAPTPERPSPSYEGPGIAGGSPGSQFDKLAEAQMRNREFSFEFTGDEQYRVTVGTMKADSLQGDDTWDHFFGRDGNDMLSGMGGNDILQGDAGDDTLVGGAGQDRLDGGPGADRLNGGDAEDNLAGGDGSDTLDAGAGHDMLDGSKGDDTYIGGMGADAFMVMPDSGNDVVLDFEATGEAQGAFDHIALIDILPSQVRVTDTASGALVWWDTNADSSADGCHPAEGCAGRRLAPERLHVQRRARVHRGRERLRVLVRVPGLTRLRRASRTRRTCGDAGSRPSLSLAAFARAAGLTTFAFPRNKAGSIMTARPALGGKQAGQCESDRESERYKYKVGGDAGHGRYARAEEDRLSWYAGTNHCC